MFMCSLQSLSRVVGSCFISLSLSLFSSLVEEQYEDVGEKDVEEVGSKLMVYIAKQACGIVTNTPKRPRGVLVARSHKRLRIIIYFPSLPLLREERVRILPWPTIPFFPSQVDLLYLLGFMYSSAKLPLMFLPRLLFSSSYNSHYGIVLRFTYFLADVVV